MSAPVCGPILQLTRHGPVCHATDRAVPHLRDAFSRDHCVKVPALLEPALLAHIQVAIARAELSERSHGAAAVELCLPANACTGLLHFLVNDAHVFRLIEQVSDCRPIRCFFGRVYRHLPDGPHYQAWHGDVHEHRHIGMSLNLSADVYEGGVFEIRDVNTKEPFGSIANIGFGDAILFRLAPTLEHRVTRVCGAFPKTAFAGWFRSAPDYLAMLRDNPFLADVT